MGSKRKYNCKFLIAILVSAVSMCGLKHIGSNDVKAADNCTINPITTTASINMLNVDSAVITKAEVKNIIGKDQQISVRFTNLPKDGKIFAVLVDEIAGGVVDSKFVDNNDSVNFTKVPEFIKLPGIHLYKQGAKDPDFLIRKENFIASTSYLMPFVRDLSTNGGLGENSNTLKAYRSNGIIYEYVPDAILFSTTLPQVYSFALPMNTLSFVEGTKGVSASDIFAVVIAEDESGKPLDVRQWVATDYEEDNGPDKYLCRFEFK